MVINFHVFTDGDAVAAGRIRNFKLDSRTCSFEYGYSWLGVNIEGRFEGTVQRAGQVQGTWKEFSKDKVGGKTAWNGRASFGVHDAGRRQTLVGTWRARLSTQDERWVVEAG